MRLLYFCKIYLSGARHGLHCIGVRIENFNRVINAISCIIHITALADNREIDA
jgi:hypothetical protein